MTQGLALGLSLAVPGLAMAGPAASAEGAEARRSPQAAVHALRAGHARFQARAMRHYTYDIDAIQQRTASAQAPFAAILACADSRVAVEFLFDQPLGELFVARVAGNIVTPAVQASLEYAVQKLGVKAVMVLGHSGCGAVSAALKAGDVHANPLFPYLQPGLVPGDPASSVRKNARAQRDILLQGSSLLRQRRQAGALAVISGVYDVGTGAMAFDADTA
ncbi:carbonic anhydrase [Bordetella pseudohinzii]|uniref:carbonic anhydrase n=1 Tax=Bordetella pseudohinzii TaxID=1331258 RepID=UPI00045A0CFB|nr:carbonic anhydrase [Bordetella pseudohinzii]